MEDIKNLFPEELNHSYVVEGDRDIVSLSVLNFIKEKHGNNSEILYQTYESFKIDDSRLIHEWHLNKSVNGQRRFCIIASKYINHDAERSLLKIIEEPNENTHFFIVVPNSSNLLDTILSRVHVVKIKNDNLNQEFKKEAIDFIRMFLKERFEFIAKKIKSYEDEESAVVRSYATVFLNFVESYFYEKLKNNKDDNVLKILEEINEKRKYLSTPGASVKMILEHIAIILD